MPTNRAKTLPTQLPCSLPKYDTLERALAAQKLFQHPFYLSLENNTHWTPLQKAYEKPQRQIRILKQDYKKDAEHYRSSLTVEQAINRNMDMVGVHLVQQKHIEPWRHIFTVGDFDSPDSKLSMIIGRLGSGVRNGIHPNVYFMHATGRKVWAFGHEKIAGLNTPEMKRERKARGENGLCIKEVLFAQRYHCTLGPGDMLFAPIRWYHSTCHVDGRTMMMIQNFEGEFQEYE